MWMAGKQTVWATMAGRPTCPPAGINATYAPGRDVIRLAGPTSITAARRAFSPTFAVTQHAIDRRSAGLTADRSSVNDLLEVAVGR